MILFIGIMHSYAQDQTIKGKIIDESTGTPLRFSTIRSKITLKGDVSNENGEFSIIGLSKNDTLIVSHVGYTTKLLPVESLLINSIVVLFKDEANLDDVIVNTGYQSLPKERATGSFEVVDMEVIKNIPSVNVMQKLEGVSSIVFDKASGRPAQTIRGLSSINNNSLPLIVLDHFPFEGDINAINPSDIENITILKDAAASSIWGTRAGNGVIVITTKKGKYNRPLNVDFNSSVQVTGIPDLFTLDQISSSDVVDLELMLFERGYYSNNESSSLRPVLSPVVEILIAQRDKKLTRSEAEGRINALRNLDYRQDFLDHVYQKAANQQYSLAFNGGDDRITYLFSGRFDNNIDNLASRFQKINLRAFNEFKLSKRISLSAGMTYSNSNRNSGRTGYSNTGTRPYYQLIDEDGNPDTRPKYRQPYLDTAGNGRLLDWNSYPLKDHEYEKGKNMVNSLLANFTGKIKVLDGVHLDLLYQYENQRNENEVLYQQESAFTRDLINSFSKINYSKGIVEYGVPLGSILDESLMKQIAHNGRASVSLNRSWDRHAWSAIAGFEVRDIIRDGSSSRIYGFDEGIYTVSNVDYVNPFVHFVTSRNEYIPNRTGKSLINNRFVSQFANVAYTYDQRYTLSSSVRRDASNLFGVKTNQKWQPLWSMGGKWNISNEVFYNSELIPFLNMRVTYGVSGSVDQSKSAVTTMIYLTPDFYTNFIQAGLSQFQNPDLRWEKIKVYNLGFDFLFKGGLFSGSIEYYNKRGEDLFGSAPLDYTTIPTKTLLRNVADMKGHGIDFNLASQVKIGQIVWKPNLMINYNQNKVTKYYSSSNLAYNNLSSGKVVSAKEGYPVYSLISYPWNGLDEEGNPQGNLHGAISTDYNAIRLMDKEHLVFSGSATPIYSGFLNQSITYRNINVFLNMSFKLGHYFRKETVKYGDLISMISIGQGSGDFAKRWQQAGDENWSTVPSFIYPLNTNRNHFYENSEILIERGDFVRFQNVVISYELKNTRFLSKNTSSQIYFNANNLGILWRANNSGIDPDFPVNQVPNPMSITLGIRLGFN